MMTQPLPSILHHPSLTPEHRVLYAVARQIAARYGSDLSYADATTTTEAVRAAVRAWATDTNDDAGWAVAWPAPLGHMVVTEAVHLSADELAEAVRLGIATADADPATWGYDPPV